MYGTVKAQQQQQKKTEKKKRLDMPSKVNMEGSQTTTSQAALNYRTEAGKSKRSGPEM